MNQAAIPVDHRLDGVLTREILEGMSRLHDLVLVFDGSGRIVWVSESLEKLCATHTQLLGAPWTALLPQVPDLDYSMRLGKLLCERGHLDSVPLPVTGADGRRIEIGLSAFNVRPASDGDRTSGLTVVILRKVEDRVRDARAMDAQLDLHRSILDAAPDAVLAFDRSSFVTYANRAAEDLLGERSASLRGKPVALFLPHAAGFGKIASVIDPRGELESREVEVRSEERRAWLSITTQALRDGDGEVVGRVAFLRDVTESREAMERLQRENEELESFVHSVSHDLRSPLVSLLGFTRLLRKDYEETLDETGRHFLDRIENAGRTMESLIHDLLELSRIGRPGERRTLVDPRAVLLQLRAELKPRLEELGIELVLPASPPLILCDRTRMYQVFSNLIGNALDHMGRREGACVRVTVLEEPERHHVVVADNGRGIPATEHQAIFEVFRTLGPKCDGQRSTGVGLAIVKRIAECHGGRAWVESEPGRGAAFHVTFLR